MRPEPDRSAAEARFRVVFAHLGAVTAYARRRGSRDAEGIAAEAMAIAWRRLVYVPADDPRPWLFATARNLLLAERRRAAAARDEANVADRVPDEAEPEGPLALDAEIVSALRALSVADREALLLVAWEDLTPKLAAQAVGISHAAFRVRLHRARTRFRDALASAELRRPLCPQTVEVENR